MNIDRLLDALVELIDAKIANDKPTADCSDAIRVHDARQDLKDLFTKPTTD